MLSEDIISRDIKFWSKVNIGEDNECWIFIRRSRSSGKIVEDQCYRIYIINGACIPAHRMAYILYYGEIPNGMLVCHSCDNKSCCNPHHLFIGTDRDNRWDAVRKSGRIQDRSDNAYRRHVLDMYKTRCYSAENISNILGIDTSFVESVIMSLSDMTL